jgi:hypothetical protein
VSLGDGMQDIAILSSRLVAAALILFGGAAVGNAQDSLLKGVAGVRVLVTWTGGVDADKDAVQSDVELKLRQAGVHVLSATEQTATPGRPLFFVGLVGSGVVIPVSVALVERAYLERDNTAFATWLDAREKQPTPITAAEFAAQTHWSDVTTWLRYGAAQSVRSASVAEIVSRYANHPYWQTPGGRAMLQPLMDAEVKAALASAQRGTDPGMVRDTVKSYVDIFINEWLTANPKQR